MNIEIILHVGDMGHPFSIFVDTNDLLILKQYGHGIAL